MQTKLIDINKINANINQPRLAFNQKSMIELANSIDENGLIQPIVVRSCNDGYEIIAGERRFRACKYLNYQTIMANIIEKNDLESAKLALIENIQRENLTVIEEALAYKKIIAETNISQSELAKQVGKSQSAIANKLRLLKLPEYIQAAVSEEKLTERHARALLGVDNNKLEQTYHKIIEDNLNVKQTEAYIDKQKAKTKKTKKKIKGYSKNIRIGINTINEAIKMCQKVGIAISSSEIETDDELTIVVKFKK